MDLIAAHKILDYLDNSILCMDQQLNIRQANATAEVFFDTSETLLVGKSFSDLFSSTERSSILSSVESSRRHLHRVVEHEAHLYLSNGKQVAADYAIHPISDEKGGSNLLVEIHPLDRHLEIVRADQRLTQQIASQQLARGLAHEIKNPLGGIRGAAQLLEGEIDNPELAEYTEVIIREADRLQALVDNMLGPNRKIEKRPINILEVLEHVRSIVLAEFAPRVEISRDYDPSIPDIDADRNQLIQALLNIVRNAAQAVGDPGQIILRTRLSTYRTILNKRYRYILQIDVVDNGPGISPDLISNIFLPMVTDKADGTGLGLPIAQQIITGHDGIIQCQSSPGQTQFNILLPLEEPV
jgi:two-component system nitrogen regulation sensor histidine kinase GlnL